MFTIIYFVTVPRVELVISKVLPLYTFLLNLEQDQVVQQGFTIIHFVTVARLGLVIRRVTQDILCIGAQSRFSYQNVYHDILCYCTQSKIIYQQGLSLYTFLLNLEQDQLALGFYHYTLCYCGQIRLRYQQGYQWDILCISTQSRFSYQKVYPGYTLYRRPEQVQLSEGLSRINFVSAPRIGLVIMIYCQDIFCYCTDLVI